MRLISRTVTIAVFLATLLPLNASAATYPHFWSQRFGDAGFQAVNAVTTDGSGNIYVIGSFTGTISLGGGGTLTSAGSYDIFLAKFSPTGVHQWSQRFGDASLQEGIEIVAAPNGEIVIAGHFQGTMTFLSPSNPNPILLASTGGTDIYVARFTTDGVPVWANRFGDVNFQYCNAIAMDPFGGVAIVGAFLGSVNFGGSSNTNLVSAGDYDIFVARFNSGGQHTWSYRFGDAAWNDATVVAFDSSSNLYFGGPFSGTFSFGGPNVTGTVDVYVAKLSNTGEWIWSKDFGDASNQYCNALVVDNNGNVFIAGYIHEGTINFGGSDLTGIGDCYLAKFNSNGAHQWSQRFGLDANPQDGRALAVDAGNNVIFAGHFFGQVDFGGGSLTSSGVHDLFLAKFNNGGDHLWSRKFGNSLNQQTPLVAVDLDDNIVYAGQFDGTVDFGGGNLSSAGGTDAFVARLGGDPFEPLITSITDIGNDQGRKVKIRFVRSGADALMGQAPIVRYDAFRRDDPAPSKATAPGDRYVMADGWTQVGSVSAYTDNTYGIDVPTIGDSTIAQGPYFSSFFIRAATSAPGMFYDSPADSGYSLDNLAPGAPTSLVLTAGLLTWNESSAGDFDYFSIYGGSTSSFGAATLINYSTSPTLSVTSSPYAFYFVTATDFSGNEGNPSMTNTTTDTERTPKSYVLSISSYPNPFNPVTTIRYTVPSKGMVEVTIFDLRGAHVATLVNEEKDMGAYTQTWEGRNDAGTRVSSGMYLARVKHPSETRSYKLVLQK